MPKHQFDDTNLFTAIQLNLHDLNNKLFKISLLADGLAPKTAQDCDGDNSHIDYVISEIKRIALEAAESSKQVGNALRTQIIQN